jgi:hypothetical protein
METAEIMNLTVDNLYKPEKKHIYNLDGKLSDHSQGNQGKRVPTHGCNLDETHTR